MSATLDALLVPGFPHATPDGFRRGCRGRACSGMDLFGFSCAQAFTRYAGDYGYRRRVDAGMSPADIAALDEDAWKTTKQLKAERAEKDRVARAEARLVAEAAEDRRVADFVANRYDPTQSGVEPVRSAPVARRGYRYWTADEDAAIRLFHSRGWDDGAIAAVIGRPRNHVKQRRGTKLRLPANKRNNRKEVTT